MSFEDKQHVCSDCWVTATAAERKRIIELLQTLRNQAQERKLNTNVNVNAIIALIQAGNK